MDAFRIAGMAVATAVLSLTLKSIRPELGMQTALAGGAVILLYAAAELSGLIAGVNAMMKEAGLELPVTGLVFRLTGIAFISQTAADICRDAGENALASKAETCGRLMMISAALPMLSGLVTKVFGMLEEFL